MLNKLGTIAIYLLLISTVILIFLTVSVALNKRPTKYEKILEARESTSAAPVYVDPVEVKVI